MVSCHQERRWHAFLFPSVIIYILGIVLILSYRLTIWLINKRYGPDEPSVADNSFVRLSKRLYQFFGRALYGQFWVGKALLICSGVVIVVSIILYFINTTTVLPVERPIELGSQPVMVIDLLCNLFFFLSFIPKFMGSYNKLMFWLTLSTFADVFTIPPIFCELALGHWWIGMRWVCFFRMLTLTDLFQSLNLLRTATQVRLAELLISFLCVWLSGAGCIHLFENSGSPSECYQDTHEISYWNSFYLVLITMSTVGYGDIYCETIAGKIFIMFFIIFAVAFFASYVPEIFDIVASSRDPYNLEYIIEFEVRTVVVGGDVSYNSVKNFVEDFTHPDRAANNYKAIIFHHTVPSPETLTLLKSLTSKLTFIKGSVYESSDLSRIKFKNASAYIILTDLSSETPDEEDMSNIMKAIAAKKYFAGVRVILQLIKQDNKAICFNLPCWTERDQIICLTEINNGFMAAGCLVPGFCTFITNLFLFISKHETSEYEEDKEWKRLYLEGAEMEIYSSRFSKYFYDKPLDEVTKFCYKKFKLLMVGVSHSKDGANNTYNQVILHPGNDYFVSNHTVGLFFSPSETGTKGVKYYCPKCHIQLKNNKFTKCNCPSFSIAEQLSMNMSIREGNAFSNPVTIDVENEGAEKMSPREEAAVEEKQGGFLTELLNVKRHNERKKSSKKFSLDLTGCYHWCERRELDACLLPNDTVSDTVKNGKHIILYSQELSPGSLRCFVLPLRVSCLPFSQIRTIVILVTDKEKLKEEWDSISTFPKVFASLGCPSNRSVLRGLNINQSHMFVVMAGVSARMALDDSRTILVTLNTRSISSIPFDISNGDVASIKRVLLALNVFRTESYCEEPISILTEICDSKSIKFVDTSQSDTDEEYYNTKPYACGKVFVSRVFDTLTTSAFFSPESYSLAKVFITGTDSIEQELLAAEGISQSAHGTLSEPVSRCTVQLLPLNSGVLTPYINACFEKLFLDAYSQLNILCIGLYRLLNITDQTKNRYERFVYTNPAPNLQLDESDLVYCLCYKTYQDNGVEEGKSSS